MPLTTTIQTLTEFRDTVSEQLGYSAYSALDTLTASHVDKALGFAMDHLAFEGTWKWLEREGTLTTTAGYSTGTVSLTNLSATATGSGTAWNTSSNVLAGDIFNAGEPGFYRVSAIASDTSATLDASYAGDTDTGLSYTTYRDRYDLADGVLEVQAITQMDPTARRLVIISPHEWDTITAGDYEVGEPEYAMLVGADQSEAGNTGTNQQVQLWPAPDATRAYRYQYRTLGEVPSSGASNMQVGPHLSALLVYKALQEIYRQRSDQERVEEYKSAYVELLMKAKRSDMARSKRVRHFSKPQWGRFGDSWPRNYTDPIV